MYAGKKQKSNMEWNEKMDRIIGQVQDLKDYAFALADECKEEINRAHPYFRESAKNLLHYIALRQHDVRELQKNLAGMGLSSLGRAESHVMSNLHHLSEILNKISNRPASNEEDMQPSIFWGMELLEANTHALFGPPSQGRDGRIMVTLSRDAAYDYDRIHAMLASGMNAARINCAHDSPEEWLAMISNIKKAKQLLGVDCKIIMDLGGPKLRTGKLDTGTKVLKWRAMKNKKGEIVAPARILITPAEKIVSSSIPKPELTFSMPEKWISQLKKGDKIRFTDRRGKKRKLKIVGEGKDGFWAESGKTAYIEPGTVMERYSPKTKEALRAAVQELPALEIPITLNEGDKLILKKALSPGRPAVINEHGQVIEPAFISCTLPQVFQHVRPDEPVYIDDGKIAGKICAVGPEQMTLDITSAKPKGSKLRGDKGINFPESQIKLNSLTDQDLQDLNFIIAHADVVSMSFVNNPSDIAFLLDELKKRDAEHLGIIVKIETRLGFENLPWILLTAMRNYPLGVMIARGDLAIECGWVRMAELQEEIMWFCEAAHVPVIWATQVLEGLTKSGLPSRAEITDAAMAQRAECVMLNKGPYIVKAIKVLDDILKRMQDHQVKKYATLRKLKVSTQFKS